jgi:hypothetical protein
MALWWTGMTIVFVFRDERGRSFATRGVDRLPAARPLRGLVSFLAIAGFLYAWTLTVYFLPFNFLAAKADGAPALPSHLRKGICSQGSGSGCPPGLPPLGPAPR